MEVVTLLLSLIFGSVGGVVVAGPIARRGAAAQKRYDAELRLAGVLRGYRSHFAHQHDQVIESRLTQHPQGYASLEGQEKLTEAVLLALPYLPRRTQRKARGRLRDLVGRSTLEFGESQLYVPEDQRSVATSADRVARALREWVREDSESGYLKLVLRTPIEEADHHRFYSRAYSTLSDLIELVEGDRALARRVRKLLVRVVNVAQRLVDS